MYQEVRFYFWWNLFSRFLQNFNRQYSQPKNVALLISLPYSNFYPFCFPTQFSNTINAEKMWKHYTDYMWTKSLFAFRKVRMFLITSFSQPMTRFLNLFYSLLWRLLEEQELLLIESHSREDLGSAAYCLRLFCHFSLSYRTFGCSNWGERPWICSEAHTEAKMMNGCLWVPSCSNSSRHWVVEQNSLSVCNSWSLT